MWKLVPTVALLNIVTGWMYLIFLNLPHTRKQCFLIFIFHFQVNVACLVEAVVVWWWFGATSRGQRTCPPPSSTEGATTQCVKGAAAEVWPEEDFQFFQKWMKRQMSLRFNLRSDAESAAPLPVQILHFLFRSRQTFWGFDTLTLRREPGAAGRFSQERRMDSFLIFNAQKWSMLWQLSATYGVL